MIRRLLSRPFKGLSSVPLILLGLFLATCGGEGGGGGTDTSGSPPIATTLSATSITPTSAILNGTVIPNGLPTQSWFEYGTDSDPQTFTSSPKQDVGNGLTDQVANLTWNGLASGTTYYFRFCVENSKEISKGPITSFTTSSPGSPPNVSSLSATSVGATGAILNGNVTPNGLATTAWFEWGTDSLMATYSSTPTQSAGSGTMSQLTSASLSGLATGTTYHFRVAASNGSGTTRGSVTSFTPGAAPTVVTLSATSVGATGATLNGNVTPNGLATTAWFEWGTDPSMTTYSTTPTQGGGSGTTSQLTSATLSGLSMGETYHFRVAASNGSGRTRGSVTSFTPGAAPTAVTLSATSVGATGATLNGNVTPNGLATTAWFEWGTDPSMTTYGSTPTQAVGSGTTSQLVSVPLSGLSMGRTYHFRVAASNGSGTSRGSVSTFTPGAAPTATTLSAISVGATEATLNGNVTPKGLATTAWFEWGTDPSMTTYGSTPTQAVGSGTTSQLASAPLSGLSTGTTYHYRVAASNGSGTSRGSVLSFTPGAAPTATTLSATSVGATGGTLNGNVTPNGLATTVWFEWGTDPSMTTYGSTPTQAVGSGTTSQPINETLSGLDGGATYYFRVVAININGDSIGETFSFTTSAPALLPTATTGTATSITLNGADISGTVNPNGFETYAWFEYGTDPSLSNPSTTDTQLLGSGSTSLTLLKNIAGLTPYTTFYFRAVAWSAGGTQWGAIKSFPTGEYFVAVGDSITDGTGDDIPADGNGYEPILQNLLSASRGIPITIANEGEGGVDSAYGAANISTTLSVYPEAKYFLILYGTNDSQILHPPVARDVYKNNMQTIVSAILAAGKTPYLAKVPYTSNPFYSVQSIQEYNVLIDELVAENGIAVSPIDFYTLLQDTRLLDADGLHPNGAGYQSMANQWFSALP